LYVFFIENGGEITLSPYVLIIVFRGIASSVFD